MRFMFFGPEVCLGLPSDSASPRTPLPPTTATAAFTAQDLHLVDNAHAGHTKRPEPLKKRFRPWNAVTQLTGLPAFQAGTGNRGGGTGKEDCTVREAVWYPSGWFPPLRGLRRSYDASSERP